MLLQRVGDMDALRVTPVPLAPYQSTIVEDAIASGCTVTTPDHDRKLHPCKRHFIDLIINDHLCSLHLVRRLSLNSGRRRGYGHACVTRSTILNVEFLILHTAVKGYVESTFVLPTHLVREHYPSSVRMGYTSLYLPLEIRKPYNTRHPRIDYWHYRDAWEQLT